MSPRMGDVGTVSSAQFSQAAIARVGQAIELTVVEVAQALFEASTRVRVIDVPPRATLLRAAVRARMPIGRSCRGVAVCAACRVFTQRWS